MSHFALMFDSFSRLLTLLNLHGFSQELMSSISDDSAVSGFSGCQTELLSLHSAPRPISGGQEDPVPHESVFTFS